MKTSPLGSWEVTIDGLIATIGATSHRVTNFIRAVRAARADLLHVTRELSDLRLELELLRDEHNVPHHIQCRGLAMLDSCGVVLRRIDGLLGGEPSPTSASPPSPQSDAARPPRWSVKERFATSNLCNCLQTYREALTLLPDVACLYVLLPLCPSFTSLPIAAGQCLRPCAPANPRNNPSFLAFYWLGRVLTSIWRRSSSDAAQLDPWDVDTAEVEEKSNRILEAVQDLREAIPQAEPAISDSRAVLELYLSEVGDYTAAVCSSLTRSSTCEPPASHL